MVYAAKIRQGPESLPDRRVNPGAEPTICTVQAWRPTAQRTREARPAGCTALHLAIPGNGTRWARKKVGSWAAASTRNCRKTKGNRIISDEKNSYGRWKREELENPPCCENCAILYSRWKHQTHNWIPPKLAGIKMDSAAKACTHWESSELLSSDAEVQNPVSYSRYRCSHLVSPSKKLLMISRKKSEHGQNQENDESPTNSG